MILPPAQDEPPCVAERGNAIVHDLGLRLRAFNGFSKIGWP
jgi:hypothetical protein